MTQADKVPGPEAPAASLTLTHNHVEPARTTALPAGRRSSSRPGGQSKSLPHMSDAQTSTVVGRGSAGSATATRTARAIAAQRTSGTSWQVSSGGGPDAAAWVGVSDGATVGVAGAADRAEATVLAAATAPPEAPVPAGVRPARASPPMTTPIPIATVAVTARTRRLRRRVSVVGSIRYSTEVAYSQLQEGPRHPIPCSSGLPSAPVSIPTVPDSTCL
jgi:hypothetical protein